MSGINPELHPHTDANGGGDRRNTYEFELCAGVLYDKEEYELLPTERSTVDQFTAHYRQTYTPEEQRKHALTDIRNLARDWGKNQGIEAVA